MAAAAYFFPKYLGFLKLQFFQSPPASFIFVSLLWFRMNQQCTFPETNIAPKNGWFGRVICDSGLQMNCSCIKGKSRWKTYCRTIGQKKESLQQCITHPIQSRKSTEKKKNTHKSSDFHPKKNKITNLV